MRHRNPMGTLLLVGLLASVEGACPARASASSTDGKKSSKGSVVSCSVSHNGHQATFRVNVKEQHGRLTLDETSTLVWPPLNQGARTLASSVAVALNGVTLVQESSTGTMPNPVGPTSSTISIHYGKGFHGVREANFSSDGTTIQGIVDGRAIVPFPIPRDRKHLRKQRIKFADGKPGPTLRTKAIVQDIAKIAKRAKTATASCFSSGLPLGDGVPGQPLQAGEGCQKCMDNCYTSFNLNPSKGGAVECTAIAIGTCIVSFGIGCVVGGAACDQALSDCLNSCNAGSDCCAVKCPHGYCCPGGDRCAVIPPNYEPSEAFANTCCEVPPDSFEAGFCSPGFAPEPASECGGICCPQGNGVACGGECCGGQCCNDVCCRSGQCCKGTCCQDQADVCSTEGACCPPLPGGPNPPISCNGVCCPAANDICAGSGCCPAGAPVCSDGTCCAQGTCLGNTCCGPAPEARVCTGSNGHQECCTGFDQCNAETGVCCSGAPCGSSCCAGNDVCVKDLYGNVVGCCAPSQVCGYTCCPSGQLCTDPHEETCSPCPSGQVACLPAGGTSAICCATGENCCLGGPDTPPMCCSDPNQQTCCGVPDSVCHAESFCIR